MGLGSRPGERDAGSVRVAEAFAGNASRGKEQPDEPGDVDRGAARNKELDHGEEWL